MSARGVFDGLPLEIVNHIIWVGDIGQNDVFSMLMTNKATRDVLQDSRIVTHLPWVRWLTHWLHANDGKLLGNDRRDGSFAVNRNVIARAMIFLDRCVSVSSIIRRPDTINHARNLCARDLLYGICAFRIGWEHGYQLDLDRNFSMTAKSREDIRASDHCKSVKLIDEETTHWTIFITAKRTMMPPGARGLRPTAVSDASDWAGRGRFIRRIGEFVHRVITGRIAGDTGVLCVRDPYLTRVTSALVDSSAFCGFVMTADGRHASYPVTHVSRCAVSTPSLMVLVLPHNNAVRLLFPPVETDADEEEGSAHLLDEISPHPQPAPGDECVDSSGSWRRLPVVRLLERQMTHIQILSWPASYVDGNLLRHFAEQPGPLVYISLRGAVGAFGTDRKQRLVVPSNKHGSQWLQGKINKEQARMLKNQEEFFIAREALTSDHPHYDDYANVFFPSVYPVEQGACVYESATRRINQIDKDRKIFKHVIDDIGIEKFRVYIGQANKHRIAIDPVTLVPSTTSRGNGSHQRMPELYCGSKNLYNRALSRFSARYHLVNSTPYHYP